MAQFIKLNVFNENAGFTAKNNKINVTQSAKKVFGELKNIQHTIPRSAAKEHHKQVLGKLSASARKSEQRQVNYDLWNDDIFAKPCCKEKHKKLDEIWQDMDMIDDTKFDDLLKMVTFAEHDDEIEKPVFHDYNSDDDMSILDLKPPKHIYKEEDVKLEIPCI